MTGLGHQMQGTGGAGMPQPVGMHLAEYNFGTLRHRWDDPRSAAFVAGLDLVNGIAAASPGFVWRETEDDLGTDGATADDLLPEDRARMAEAAGRSALIFTLVSFDMTLLFQCRMGTLVIQAPALRSARRFGGQPRLGCFQRGLDQRDQTLPGIFPVAFLAAETLGLDDDFAGFGDALVALCGQAPLDFLGQSGAAPDEEAQFDGGRDFIDVLPARAAGADGVELDLARLGLPVQFRHF